MCDAHEARSARVRPIPALVPHDSLGRTDVHFLCRCIPHVAAAARALGYGLGVLEAHAMLNRSTLIRSALIGVSFVALVALADGMARAQLERAVESFPVARPQIARPPVAVKVAGAVH